MSKLKLLRLQFRMMASALLQELAGTKFWAGPILLGLGFLSGGATLSAHSSSIALLHLDRIHDVLHARIEVPLRDLEEQMGLDANDDGILTWGEIRHRERDLLDYVRPRLALETPEGALPISLAPIQISRHEGEAYVSIEFGASPIPRGEELRLRYGILLDRDSLHRCLIQATWSGETRIAGRGREVVAFPPARSDDRTSGWFSMVTEGTHHIWTGYDHLLFLFTLLLPSVLYQTREGWAPRVRPREVLREVLQVVTAFTVAHSLTLCAATLGLVHLSSRLVETTIAASILVAAAANLLPVQSRWKMESTFTSNRRRWLKPPGWVVAFAFGLIHGFGFASVLENLGLEKSDLFHALIGFNVGVEAGQLAIVAMFLPAALLIRGTRFYRGTVIPVASILILVIAGGWMIERAMELRFMPF